MSSPERVSTPAPSATASSCCSHCGEAVDPLRAARVRVIGDQFHYFCSFACAQDYVPSSREDEAPTPASPHRGAEGTALARDTALAKDTALRKDTAPLDLTALPDVTALSDLAALPDVTALSDLAAPPDVLEADGNERALRLGVAPAPAPSASPRSGSGNAKRARPSTAGGGRSAAASHVGPPTSPGRTAAPVRAVAPQPTASSATTVGRPLSLALAIGSAMLSILMLLALEGRVTDVLRLAFVSVASGALSVYVVQRYLAASNRGTRRVTTGAMAVLGTGIGVIATLLAALSIVAMPEQASAALSFAGAQLAMLGVILIADEHFAAPLEYARVEIANALDHPILRVNGEQGERIPTAELRPGEEIVVHAGETIPVDASIIAGSGEVHPWLNSETVRSVGSGDFVYAGARLVSGQLRAVVRWTGNDRHWMRLTNDPNRRVDRWAPGVQLARRFALRAAPVGMAFGLLTSLAQGHGWVTTSSYVLAAAAVFLNPAMVRLIELDALRTILKALANGIVVRSAATLDAAGKVSAAVFCARGTLLLGEPQLSTLETLGALSEEEILSLVAGAEQAANHPIATSVLRAARERGATPDAVRSPRSEPGLGVTALASDGRKLVVGSRGLMLRERVSVARAEQRITELEASGRTVLLVALGGHLSGILALQDGLRAGARAAVQHLLDAGIEPILLSGDARETCEALARTIDIDHIRPEVLPPERGQEVERLCAGGGAVAVVGRSPVDDLALAAASVSLALPSQGSQAGGFDIELAGDEVQKAALALRLLHQHRAYAIRVLVLLAGGGALAILASLALAIPAGWVPILMLGFGASALLAKRPPKTTAISAAAA